MTTTLPRRRFVMGLGLATGAAAAPLRATQPAVLPAIPETCAPLTGLTFTAPEQQQMLGVVDEIVDRARALARMRFANELPPAELFDPRLPGWQREPDGALAEPAPPLPSLSSLPSTADEIAFSPAWQLAAWLRTGKLKSRTLTDIYLDRIAAHADRLQCIATLLPDAARREADACDRDLARGRLRGSLHGLPYGLKDLIDTAGVETAWGAEPYRGRVPAADATIVRRLREEGAILLAKTSLGAIAYGDIWYGGRTRNPWNVAEGSSGSSAGSAAAVAAGLCAFAIGTETMGSIVSPAARCGAVGLRPTFGRVPRTGAMALCWSLDKVGVLARDPLDAAMSLAVLHGPDGADPCAIAEPLGLVPRISPQDIRIGYRPEWFTAGTEADRAALSAAREAGFDLREIEMPDVDLAGLGGIVVLEAAAAFQELTASGRDDLLTWQDDIAWPNSWRSAQFETAVNYIQAQRLRRRLMIEFAQTMAGVDMILHPNDAGGLLAIGNHCGYPALCMPVGMLEQPTRQGFTSYVPPADLPRGAVLKPVPFSITLTGRLFDEPRLIAAGRRLAEAIGLPSLRPLL
ncbi:amidase [Novosphingobium sp. M1R2S20]|uniref:Amidase n=1 Tax=Novosphingobium rhizovicinum TaxID=3228928 RepID=A0ABV3RC24_9SPHN